jgi:hypothetical protein
MPTANRVPDDLQRLLPLTPAVFFYSVRESRGGKARLRHCADCLANF